MTESLSVDRTRGIASITALDRVCISHHTRDSRYICPELVCECFNSIGIPFHLADEYASPDDIWQDRQVQMQYRIM